MSPASTTSTHRAAAPFIAVNVVTLDQEKRGIVAVVNGGEQFLFDPAADLDVLPAGGGYVVADGNVWSVRNELSQSQYCWASAGDLETFLAALAERGYRGVTVANKLANTQIRTYGTTQADAVSALYRYVHDQISNDKGRPVPELAAAGVPLPCGCAHHWGFDSGHAVRAGRGDLSYGLRAQVTGAFLRMQNTGGYDSPFAEQVVQIAWAALDSPGRKAFNIAVRTPTCAVTKRNRLMAVAVCTHDPATGQLRTHDGRPWGLAFITGRVIGLNGAMRGTGAAAPGNPMRAVLRVLGRRWGTRVNRAERADLDRYVRTVIRALQQHPVLPGSEPV